MSSWRGLSTIRVYEGTRATAPNPARMDQLERIRSHRRAVLAGCGVVAVAAGVFGVTEGRAAAATTPETFAVVLGPPRTVTTIDLGGPGKTPGDLYAIRSTIHDPGGAEIGHLVATQTSIQLEHGFETVQVSGTFELPAGTIAIGGLSLYTLEGTGNVPGRTFVRPVLGGTGRYAGVGGTVTTVQAPDGRYEQRFSLTGVPTPSQRVVTQSTGGFGERIDLGVSGPTPGDLHVFGADIVDGRGQPFGRLRGTSMTLDTGTSTETMGSNGTFETDGGQLAVSGLPQMPLGDRGGLIPDEPFAFAVIGGTGDYAARAGTMTITRTPSGRYQQTFDLQPPQQLTRTLRLIAGRGVLHSVDLAPAGQSAADLNVFGGPVRDRRGRRAGRARGVQTTVVRDGTAFTVQASITYALRGGQIVVGGLSQYPATGDRRPIRGRTFVRPVLGGTGRYAGARGTLSTTTRANGSFRQVFRLTE